MKVYIDGNLVDEADAKISVLDHGLLYGDGVFEGIRFYEKRVFKLHEHVDRLYDSARAILMDIPMTREEMADVVIKTIAANDLTDGYVRLLVTRGVGNLGLSPFSCKTPSIIVIASKITLYPAELYEDGLEIITCSTRRNTPAALSPAIKSLNYLNNVLAKIEALHAGCQEGIMLNEQGYVSECTGDNLFIIKKGKISTPQISSGALDGITRAVIFDLADEMGETIHEVLLTRYDIYTADECFLTGTAAEVIPVVKLDGRTIGDGKPGATTLKLINAYTKLAGNSGTPIAS